MSPRDYQRQHADVIALAEEDLHDKVPVVRFVGHDGASMAMKVLGGWQYHRDPVTTIYRPMMEALMRRRDGDYDTPEKALAAFRARADAEESRGPHD